MDNRIEVKRPYMASDALDLIEASEEIEIETKYVFAFMRCCENNRRKNLNFTCSINKYNQGYTAIKK